MDHDSERTFRWSDAGASESAVERAQADLQAALPGDYVMAMRAHNGGEGWIGQGAYLRLWPIEEVASNNETLGARDFVPGVTLIGTDGAGELFGVEAQSGRFMSYPAVGLEPDAGEPLGTSWEGFLRALAAVR
jgi:hypothetical protein